MKKYLSLFALLCALILVTACSQKAKEDPVYDDKFMLDLAKGLEERWAYTDDPKNNTEISIKKGFETALSKELEKIEPYQDLKFKDSKLKESALSYINEIKNGQKIVETFGSDSFYTNWDKHYKARNEKLIAINTIQEIKVSKKYQSTLEELLASGKEVQNKRTAETAIDDLFKTFSFTRDEVKSDEYHSEYTTTVENTSGVAIKNISGIIKLLDDQGVVVDQVPIYANDWKVNEKRVFEFITTKTFTKTEIVLEMKQIGE